MNIISDELSRQIEADSLGNIPLAIQMAANTTKQIIFNNEINPITKDAFHYEFIYLVHEGKIIALDTKFSNFSINSKEKLIKYCRKELIPLIEKRIETSYVNKSITDGIYVIMGLSAFVPLENNQTALVNITPVNSIKVDDLSDLSYILGRNIVVNDGTKSELQDYLINVSPLEFNK